MEFFEGKWTYYLVLYFIITPLGSAALMWFVKRRIVWIAPIISVVVGLLLTGVFYPFYYFDIMGGEPDATTVWWCYLLFPSQAAVSVITAAAFPVIHRLRRGKTIPETETEEITGDGGDGNNPA